MRDSTEGNEENVVLVVEDDTELARLFVRWLSEDHTVRWANNCAMARASLDEDVEVALIDRMLPDGTGEDVLRVIHSRGIDCRVAMVTAVEPKLDVIEMGFDEYLLKPVDANELRHTVNGLLDLQSYDESIQEYFELVTKFTLLRGNMNPSELESSEAYTRLEDRLTEVKRNARRDLERVTSPDDFNVLFERISHSW